MTGVRGGGEGRFMGNTCITQTSGVHSSSPQVDGWGWSRWSGLDLNLLPAPTADREGGGRRTVSETVRTLTRRDVHNYTVQYYRVQTRGRLDPRPRSSAPFNGENSLPESTVFGLRLQIDEFVNVVSHIHKKWCFL